MRKKLLTTGVALVSVFSMYAGGLLTNTNQHVSFLRNPARDASTEIDAAYTNPAGLTFLKKDGFFLSLNNQSAFQTRTITTDFAPFAGNGGSAVKEFEGKAKAMVIPNLQAAYKTGNWVISANVGIEGGGGTLDFSKGLPSFESQVALLPITLQQNGIPVNSYSLDSRLKGSSVIYGIQLGLTYKMNDYLSAYIGGRASIVNNGYDGYIRNIQAKMADGMEVGKYLTTVVVPQLTGTGNSLQPIINGGMGGVQVSQLVAGGYLSQTQVAQMAAGLGLSPAEFGALTVSQAQGAFFQKAAAVQGVATQVAAQTVDKELNCKQNGIGFAPIIGFNYHWNGLNIGVKYEFQTGLELKNKTTTNTTGLTVFDDGAKTPYDIPALLAVGAQYDIVPGATLAVGYHHFFESAAKMTGDKQQLINSGTNEYLAGVEYRINRLFLLSYGIQFTRFDSADAYLTDMSFTVNSYSFGLGGAIYLTDDIRVNLGYFFTNFYDRNKKSANYVSQAPIPGTDTFSRTSKAFGIGLDFRF